MGAFKTKISLLFLSKMILQASISVLILLFLSGCNASLERLKRVGQVPEFSPINSPLKDDVESMPEQNNQHIAQQQITYEQPASIRSKATNSLWQPGNTSFFRDNRAWRVGDILKVLVEIKDSAKLDNSSNHNKNNRDGLGITEFFGKAAKIANFFDSKANKDKLVDTSSSKNYNGSGNISRNEDIKMNIAAVVTKVLPNGNLMIQGKQEVRVNYELREIIVSGIIRPKDISAANAINADQIAEARISYGGRGFVSDVQQPPIGSQVLDIIKPF